MCRPQQVLEVSRYGGKINVIFPSIRSCLSYLGLDYYDLMRILDSGQLEGDAYYYMYDGSLNGNHYLNSKNINRPQIYRVCRQNPTTQEVNYYKTFVAAQEDTGICRNRIQRFCATGCPDEQGNLWTRFW